MSSVLVGRDVELDTLTGAIAAVRPLLVSGEAGVGKTSVLVAAAGASGRTVWLGGGLATLAWTDLLPLRRALGRPLRGSDAAAVAAEVERTVGGGVLVIDDAQWADRATLDVLAILAGRVRVLAGVRSHDPGAEAAIDCLCGAGFGLLELAVLERTTAAALLDSLRPDLSAAAAGRLIRAAGGNPLLLRELSATGRPSASLRRVVAARLGALDEPGREAFTLLAVAGRPLAVDELGRTGVKALVGAGLAAVEGDAVGIRHALFGEVLLDELDADTRGAAHATLARRVGDLGESARHHALAGEHEAAHVKALAAAAGAARPGERAAHLRVAASCASGAEADDLRLRAAEALETAEDWEGVEAVLAEVAAADPEALANAALLRARGAWYRGDAEAMQRELDAGIALVDGSGCDVEVRLRVERCRTPIFVECDWTAGIRAASAALELAQRTGVDEARAEYFLGTAMAQIAAPGWDAHLAAAIDLARRRGETGTELRAANNLVISHESSGSPAEGRRLALEMASRAHALGLGFWERGFRGLRLNLDFHAAAYGDVIAEAEQLLAEPLDPRAQDAVEEALMLALIDVGRADEAVRRLDDAQRHAVPDHRGQGRLDLVRSELELALGRPREAVAAADRYLASTPAGDGNTVLATVTRAWARWEAGLDPGEPVPTQSMPILFGATPETDALRLLHAGSFEAAAAAFDRAADLWAPYHRRGELRCRWAAGDALCRAGSPAGVVRLEDVEGRAVALGMRPLVDRVRQSLRTAGVRRSAARRAVRGDAGGGSRGGGGGGRSGRGGVGVLSGREREVLALVAAGLSNRDIARQLRLSPRTVETQLRTASAKLGATSRAQAASLAQQPLAAPARFVVIDAAMATAQDELAAAQRRASARGFTVVDGVDRSSPGVVCTLNVRDRHDAARAVASALDGVRLIVLADAAREVVDRLCDDLRRLGPLEHRTGASPVAASAAALADDQVALLRLLLDGSTLGQAATALGLARRTADRRLAAARRALGAATTAEALTIARGLGLGR